MRSSFAIALGCASAIVVAACGSSSGSSSFTSSGGSVAGASSGGVSSGGSSTTFSSSDGGASTATFALDAGCATASAAASRAPVYMLFVLDGSGSMGQENKWTAVTGALNSMFSTMENDPGMGAGLIVFADTLDQTMSTGPGPYPEPGIDVPIGYVTTAQDSALDARMTGSPDSNTPTYYALQGGYGELGSFTPGSPLETGGSKVLVLITDGVPTDHYCATSHAGTNYPTNPCVEMAATQDSASSPVLTFVIGVGQFPSSDAQDFDPAFLGNLALAGGGAPAGCDPNETQTSSNLCYFEVDPTQASSATTLQAAFTNALDAIRGQVQSCTFPLESTGLGAINAGLVNVTLDGAAVPQSPTNGWTFDDPQDPTAIIFNGAACAEVKNDATAKVSIVVGCATLTAK
jgi:uncharacterized protein YegL